MCGIAGFLANDARAPGDLRAAVRVAEALRHRGPDASGSWSSGPCALAHRRLSIIDLSPEANQPMTNETGDVAVVVNGEIYDFAPLRDELRAKGHVFRSESDSEVALHLYEEMGDDFVRRLDGMFALLLWDARRNRLVAARDRSGKKPLFYRVLPHGIAFASEVGALVTAFPEHRPEVDLRAIDEYLTLQYVPAPRTAYAGAFKIPAAHVAVFEPGAPEAKLARYWSKPSGELDMSEREAEDELLRLMRRAVRRRLVADVPLGAFLSGGLDSSTIVALMAEASSRPVKTFSIGFPDSGDSELPYARLVAERFGTEHHEEVVTPEMTSVLGSIVRHHGQPFADSSAVATYYLAEMTRKHVTVALSGDGSDEILAGYKRYGTARIGHVHDALPEGGRRALRAALTNVISAVKPSLGDLGATLGLGEAARYARLVGQLGPEEKRALYLAPMRDAAGSSVIELFERVLAASSAKTAMGRLCDLDFNTYLEGDINAKVDIAAMTHALEVRCPFLDTAVVELAARLPMRLLMRARGKYLLRRATRKLLPPRTRFRIKRGFALPLERWMRRDLREMTRDVLLGKRATERGLFDPAAVAKLVDDLDRDRASPDHVWTLLVLELWFRAFIDAGGES
ncbi:MAG TPA: asparagine synthase (glutamine-hydrolyzing) [Polyangiaceae bacterium]